MVRFLKLVAFLDHFRTILERFFNNVPKMARAGIFFINGNFLKVFLSKNIFGKSLIKLIL
jgi:hypothetical protein